MIFNFKNRDSLKFFIWGIVLFMFGAVYLTKDHFFMGNAQHRKLITRQNDPLIYWGIEAVILIVAITLCKYAFYRNQRK